MSLIQLVLLLCCATAFLLYLKYFRSVGRDRILAFLLLACAVVATLFPDATTTIANWVGVGRGVDLVFYIFAITTVFIAIQFYSKLARIEHSQTQVIRELAIQNARPAKAQEQ